MKIDDLERPVLIRETDKIYESLEQAATSLMARPYILLRYIQSGNIYQAFDGSRIHLEFTDREPNVVQKVYGKIRVKETGHIYRNIQEAREQTGIIEPAILRLIESGRQGRTVYGKRIHLEFVED